MLQLVPFYLPNEIICGILTQVHGNYANEWSDLIYIIQYPGLHLPVASDSDIWEYAEVISSRVELANNNGQVYFMSEIEGVIMDKMDELNNIIEKSGDNFSRLRETYLTTIVNITNSLNPSVILNEIKSIMSKVAELGNLVSNYKNEFLSEFNQLDSEIQQNWMLYADSFYIDEMFEQCFSDTTNLSDSAQPSNVSLTDNIYNSNSSQDLDEHWTNTVDTFNLDNMFDQYSIENVDTWSSSEVLHENLTDNNDSSSSNEELDEHWTDTVDTFNLDLLFGED